MKLKENDCIFIRHCFYYRESKLKKHNIYVTFRALTVRKWFRNVYFDLEDRECSGILAVFGKIETLIKNHTGYSTRDAANISDEC